MDDRPNPVRPGLLAAFARQWRVERRVRLRGGSVRTCDPAQIRSAYDALTRDEFDAINGPQRWANWTVVPAALSGLLPDRPLSVVDLGCGIGDSLQVLAWCTKAGSRLTGLDLSEGALATARSRAYRHADGRLAQVEFRQQSIVEALQDAAGHHIGASSLDLAASSGVIGHHLDPDAVVTLAGELRRVLAPLGLALLDSGPRLSHRVLRSILERAGFRLVRMLRYGPFNSRAEIAFERLA